jgi:hypothetical protein
VRRASEAAAGVERAHWARGEADLDAEAVALPDEVLDAFGEVVRVDDERSAPAAMRRRATISRIGTPPTSTSAFGRSFVSGCSRVPRPAAKIMASMAAR